MKLNKCVCIYIYIYVARERERERERETLEEINEKYEWKK